MSSAASATGSLAVLTARSGTEIVPGGASGPGPAITGVVIPHHTSAPSPTKPATVPTRPTHSAVVVPYMRLTCLLVGTTTMKLGVARHGPSAPSASQFGKYDVFTITGTPVRDTSNEIESSVGAHVRDLHARAAASSST